MEDFRGLGELKTIFTFMEKLHRPSGPKSVACSRNSNVGIDPISGIFKVVIQPVISDPVLTTVSGVRR